MSKHKYTNVVCIVIVAAMLLASVLFCMSGTLGITATAAEMPYTQKLFTTDRVHTMDIVMNESDWESLLANAANKEYVSCTLVIDGESFKNVALRTKGNSSLSSIVSSESDRYSFKAEFDHYDKNQNYYGLDKLALNNVAQDNTYLKDYLSYRMMDAFDAASPLCSFIYLTVNGKDWGLYLAVEGIEDAFAERNYGSASGVLYKPDSMDILNGGNGINGDNGGFTMPDFSDENGFTFPETQNGDTTRQMPDFSNIPDNMEGMGGGMGGMMGANDVALIYTDDAYESYANIFDNAVTDVTTSDKDRLIAALKKLNAGEDLEEVLNVDEVLRYFVVHNFVLNFDSYTGSMMHNYYLYEEDGQLSMIAWDYNLAFGAFGGMGGMGNMGNFAGNDTESDGSAAQETASADSSTSMINYPIDTPLSGATLENRPMLNALLSNETYLEEYHSLFAQFIDEYFDNGSFAKEIDSVVQLISPYVEKDPTAFCTYDEFLEAAQMLKEFCLLRAESVRGQLAGSIPATTDGQNADSSGFIDGSGISMDVMGSSATSFGMGGMRDNRGAGWEMPENGQMPEGGQSAEDGLTSGSGDSAENAQPPDDAQNPAGGGRGETQQGNFNFPGGITNTAADTAQGTDAQNWIFLGASILILTFGLVFAKLFTAE